MDDHFAGNGSVFMRKVGLLYVSKNTVPIDACYLTAFLSNPIPIPTNELRERLIYTTLFASTIFSTNHRIFFLSTGTYSKRNSNLSTSSYQKGYTSLVTHQGNQLLLVKLAKVCIIVPRMGRIGEGAGRSSQPITAKSFDANVPSVKLWQAIDAADRRVEAERGKSLLEPARRQVLQLYLTTGATAKHLKPIAGVRTETGVYHQLVNSVEKVFPHLPEELQQEYQTPKQALRTKSGKRMYAEYDKTNLTNAALRRWKRYREVDKPQGKKAFSEQGLANIHAHSGRWRRTPPEAQ